MRILITGADGMLGTAVKETLHRHTLIATDKKTCDVTNYKQVMSYQKRKIDYIIHLAAETDLEVCESNPLQAYMTNTIGTENVVLLAKKLEIPIIYISTAGVFDGEKRCAYFSSDEPNPINVYGRSKYYGELLVRAHPRHFILRAGWMMGGGKEIDKKFINKIYKLIKKGHKKLYVINTVKGSPTYTKDLSLVIQQLIETYKIYGTYHSAGFGCATRYQVAKLFVRTLKLDNRIKVIPVQTMKKVRGFPCKRSRNEALVNTSWINMRRWEDALREYTNEYFK